VDALLRESKWGEGGEAFSTDLHTCGGTIDIPSFKPLPLYHLLLTKPHAPQLHPQTAKRSSELSNQNNSQQNKAPYLSEIFIPAAIKRALVNPLPLLKLQCKAP
jgi:hypothetical protein